MRRILLCDPVSSLDRSLHIATIGFFFYQIEILLAIRYLRASGIQVPRSSWSILDGKTAVLRMLVLTSTEISFLFSSSLAYIGLSLFSAHWLLSHYRRYESSLVDTAVHTLCLYTFFGSAILLTGSDSQAALNVLVIGACTWLTLYFFSGSWKLAGEAWMKGDALSGILSTYAFGTPSLAVKIHGQRWVKMLQLSMPWFLMSIGPLILFGEETVAWAAILFAGAFHLLNLILMGIRTYFFAYLAFLPGIYSVAFCDSFREVWQFIRASLA